MGGCLGDEIGGDENENAILEPWTTFLLVTSFTLCTAESLDISKMKVTRWTGKREE